MSRLTLLTLALLLPACGDKPKEEGGGGGDEDTGSGGDDTGDGPPSLCETLELPEREFDATEPANNHRWEPAGDFTVPLLDGSSFTLSESWSGCESYVFLPHWWTISAHDSTTWWTTGVADLIERSPANVHYFFVTYSNDSDEVDTYGTLIDDEISVALAELDTEDHDWWSERLHVVGAPLSEIDGLVGDMSSSTTGQLGWAIDREQRIRTVGYMPDVEAYVASLNSAGEWPWEQRLYSAAGEAKYFNFEAERQAALDAVSVTEVEIFGGDVIEEYHDGTMSLPDAATMAGFDTLEIDVLMECPDKDSYELSNCGAWDYLAYMWLYDDETESWLEMGRFITTYHRESRWVVDGTHALGWLQDGGDRTIRYQWAPSWNTQPTGVTLKLRLSNQGKGTAPREVVALFTGGTYSETYNEDRPPVEVEIPADATKVELVSIATGHGQETNAACAEFCEQVHTFGIGSESWEQVLDNAGTEAGCRDDVENGTVPNQAGTWWFGRAGWCPGKRVDPYVVDVTDQVTPGETATVSYSATILGDEPESGLGSNEMRSWLVFHN